MKKCRPLVDESSLVQSGIIQNIHLPKDEQVPSNESNPSSEIRSARTSHKNSIEADTNPTNLSNRQLDFVSPAPDGGLQAWLQGRPDLNWLNGNMLTWIQFSWAT
jgi:hypothetical protein